MENVIYDEVKKVYRVTHANGSFDTYTPTQFREQFGATPVNEEEEEEADIVIDATETGTEVVVTQEVLDENPILADEGLKVGDVGVVTEDGGVDFSTDTEEEEVTNEPNTQE